MNQPQPEFTKTMSIPACRLKKELLIALEKIVLQYATDLLAEGEKLGNYRVCIRGRDSRLELPSVEDMSFPLQSDTTSVEIEYRELSGFNVKITFGQGPRGSLSESMLEIRCIGKSAPQTANGIANHIIEEIHRFPHPTIIRRIGDLWYGLILSLAFGAVLSAVPLLIRNQTTLAVILLVVLGVLVAYFYFSVRVPYCLFDTLKNDRLVDSTNRLLWVVIGFVMTGIVGRWLISLLVN